MRKLYIRKEFFGSVVFNPASGKYYTLAQEHTNELESMFTSDGHFRGSPVEGVLRRVLGESLCSEPLYLIKIINKTVRPRVLSAPFKAFFNITKRCNLYCKHCYNNSGEPNSPELEYVHVAHTLNQLQQQGVFKVTLAGGEPLFHRELDKILEFLSGTDLYISMVTNGIGISEDLANKLDNLFNLQSITVSLDGAVHSDNDHVRGTHSFRRTIHGLEILSKCFHKSLAVRVTLMQSNINNITKLPELLAKLGISELKVNSINPYGRAKLNDNLLIVDGLYRDARQRLYEAALSHGLIMQVPSYKYQKDENGQVGLCRAGEETFEIDGDGNVYPCSFSFGRFCAGNVRTSSFDDIFANLQRHSINNDWCYNCKGRGGKNEKIFGYVPELVEFVD